MDPSTINRPGRIYAAGPLLNGIEQRWLEVRDQLTTINPAWSDFLTTDVAVLLRIAKAAYALHSATNAEASRQASERLHAAFRV